MHINTIHQKDKSYYFKVENSNYILLIYNNLEEIDDIYKLNSYLINFFPFHKIVLNINNEIITTIKDNKYILLQLFINKKISINDIIELNNIGISYDYPKLKRDNWFILWTNKIDYFEYQISQIGKKYPIICESFNYYIGLAENAIALVNNTDKSNISIALAHRRISNNSFDLYNPLNLVIDFRIRDVCEYFKYCFFNNIDISQELDLFLTYNHLNVNEANLFLARMLFPTYYFDLYEKIINDEVKEEEIKKIISKADSYERLLKQIYYRFKNNQLYIEWLEN